MLAISRTCANPSCDVTFTGRRNKLTCSPRCRKAFQRYRDEVLGEIERLLETLGEAQARERFAEDEAFAASLREAADAAMRRRDAYEGLSSRKIDPRLRRRTTRTTSKLPPEHAFGGNRRRR